MQNESIESLLLRHYGSTAQAPVDLEEHLCASLRQEVTEMRRRQQVTTHWLERRVSRRRVLQLVTMGTAGLGALSASIGNLRSIETTLVGHDVPRPAYS
jgi:hypothetical protein